MAISKLDFARGQVVNPLDSIGDDLLKFGSSLHQQEKDRLETIRQVNADKRAQEQLDMQKQQYADQKADKQFASDYLINLQKPRQLAEASALFKQVDADKAAFDKRMESVAYTEPENVYTSGTTDQATKDRLVASGLVNPAEVERKTKQQMDLAGMVLAPTEAMKETEYQHAQRTAVELAKNGRVAPISVLEKLEALRVADIAANKEKQKLFEAQKKELSNDIDSSQIKAAEAYDKSLRGVFGKNGISQNDDGSYTINPSAANIKATDKELAGYSAGMAEILKAVNDGKFGTQKADAIAKAVDMYDVLMRTEGVNAKDAAKIVAETIPNMKGEDGIGNLWGLITAKLKDLQIDPKVMEAIVKTGVKRERLDQQTGSANAASQSLTAQVASAQAIKKAAELRAVTGNQAGLLMTPEERQYAATKNRLDEILKPTVDMERESASASSLFDAADGSKIKKSKDLDANIDKAIVHLADIKEVVGKDGNKVPVKLGEAQIWGIIGNVVPESGFDSGVVGDKNLGGVKDARGIMQWRLDRADALRNFAGEKDISKIPMETQLKFAVQEMAQRAPVDKRNFNSQLEEYMSIKDPKEAAAYVSAHYEVAKGNSTRENEARLRGDLTDRLYRDNQKSVADSWNKSDKDASVIASYKQDLTDALKDKDFDAALAIGDRLKAAGVPDAELQKLAAGSSSSVDIKKLFEDAVAAPAAPVMPAVAKKTAPTPGYQVIADAAGSLGTTAMSMLKDSPVGYLMNGKNTVKPAVAVLNNTAAGMLQIAGSPYTATKLFTDWLVTGKTESSIFDRNAQQAYDTAVQALNEYGIKNPTAQQVTMLVSDMMAPGGVSKVVKGVTTSAPKITEKALARILKNIQNDSDAYTTLQRARASQYEVPIGPSVPQPTGPRNVIISSPEELAAAEARRKQLLGM